MVKLFYKEVKRNFKLRIAKQAFSGMASPLGIRSLVIGY